MSYIKPVCRKAFPLMVSTALLALTAGLSATTASAEIPARHMEKLDRGTVAIKAEGGILVSWRMLADDPDGTAFNLYRDGQKLNTQPIQKVSNFLDKTGTDSSAYTVSTVLNGKETKGTLAPARVWANGYLSIPLDKPADGVTPDGKAYS